MSRLLCFGLFFVWATNLISASTSTKTECGLEWRNRTIASGSVACYWFEPAQTNVSWRDALWSCRDRDAEMFEPVDEMEMRWVERELSPDRMRGGAEWHVYGHSSFYGPNAWHSGASLSEFPDSRLVRTPEQDEQFACEAGSKQSRMPSECALLRLSTRREFELSFSNCLHVDKRNKIGYVCKRELNREPATRALMRASSSDTQCKSEWFSPPVENDYVYSISRPSPNLSWYEALQLCREKGGELPTIESAAEATWIRDQVQRFSSSRSKPGRIFVNLHEWAYNRNGWGWNLCTPLDSSVLQWASGEPDENCDNQDNCASLAWNDSKFKPVLSDQFCHLYYSNVTLVCKRLRTSCLPSTSRMSTTNFLTTRNPWGIKFEWDLLTGGDEFKWILLAGGSTIVSFLVILTVTFVICCQWCRRSRMTSKRTPPNRSDSVFSGQSENVYEEPDSEPRTTTKHSSGAPVSNQNSRKTNANTTQSNKKKPQVAQSQKSGTGPLYTIPKSRDSLQHQAKGLFELVAPSAPLPSQLNRQESVFSYHTYQEIEVLKETPV